MRHLQNLKNWTFFLVCASLRKFRKPLKRAVLTQRSLAFRNENIRKAGNHQPDSKIKTVNVIDQLNAVRSLKKKSPIYETLASQCVVSLKDLIKPYWSEDYKILTGGASNLLTAEMCLAEKRYFVKVTKKRKDSEFQFYNLLLDSLVQETGDLYSFVKPVHITNNKYVRAYVFPYLSLKIIDYNKKNISFVINALAEIMSRHRSQSALQRMKLRQHNFEVSARALKTIETGVLFNDKDEERSALKRHEAILADWDSVTSALKQLKPSLCNRDIRQENLAIINKKLILFDMGSVELAPPGVDLYQLIHETKQITSRAQTCIDYATALKALGVKRSSQDIELAVCAASAYKWLNVSERDASTLKPENYLYALECAEFCTRVCNS